jgi:phage tail-like protein
MAEKQHDALTAFHFGVEIQDVIKGYFTKCSGLGSENDVIEHKVVNDKGQEIVIKTPGRLKWSNIVLEWGITDNMGVWNWRKQVEDGKVEEARKNGSIIMFDQQLKEVARWNFENAWPVKVTGPELDTGSNNFGIEKFEIAYEAIHREK